MGKETGCDLSIIIVNWNTRDLLRDCLASLPSACGDLVVETLVVDNDSADGSAAMVRDEFPGCEVIESGGNLGFSRGNNLALASARGDRLLLLNPDTVCPADSLVRLAAALDTLPDAWAVGPALIDADGLPAASYGDFPTLRRHLLSCLDPANLWLARPWRNRGLGSLPVLGGPDRRVDYVKGACLMFTRAAHETVGALDERFFMYFEETDWCLRARRAGGRVWLCPGVEVAHLEGKSAEQVSDFSLRQFQHSYRLFMAKHRGDGWVDLLRIVQYPEYRLKGLLRKGAALFASGPDAKNNRTLARLYHAIARLQLESEIDPRPPASR